MTDTEAKALARSLMLIATNKALPDHYRDYATGAAHYIEATEARHTAELREQAERFSEVAAKAVNHMARTCFAKGSPCQIERETVVSKLTDFIIAKPDPLVEAWGDMLRDSKPGEDRLEVFRAAIKKRGGKIVWGEG